MNPVTAQACALHRLHVCDRSDPGRGDLERFVQRAFDLRHRAQVRSFMPTLLALRGDQGRVCGVAGYRSAATETLFLEQYLDDPVEQALRRAAGRSDIARHEIVEVGNLAGLSCRAAMRLVVTLPQLLLDRGHRWIVFTATDTVRQMLARYRAPLMELCVASPDRVAGGKDEWGRYYTTDPRVMAGYLTDGLRFAGKRHGAARDGAHVE